jgi:hypothetical protein
VLRRTSSKRSAPHPSFAASTLGSTGAVTLTRPEGAENVFRRSSRVSMNA